MNNFKERFSSIKSKTQELIKLTEEGITWLDNNGSNETKQSKKHILNEEKIILNRESYKPQKKDLPLLYLVKAK